MHVKVKVRWLASNSFAAFSHPEKGTRKLRTTSERASERICRIRISVMHGSTYLPRACNQAYSPVSHNLWGGVGASKSYRGRQRCRVLVSTGGETHTPPFFPSRTTKRGVPKHAYLLRFESRCTATTECSLARCLLARHSCGGHEAVCFFMALFLGIRCSCLPWGCENKKYIQNVVCTRSFS